VCVHTQQQQQQQQQQQHNTQNTHTHTHTHTHTQTDLRNAASGSGGLHEDGEHGANARQRTIVQHKEDKGVRIWLGGVKESLQCPV
jgi:hypothetical protein